VTSGVRYREKLWVPWYWWVLAAGFALSMLLAAAKFLGPAVGLGIGLGTMAVAGAILYAYSRTEVRVDDEGLHVGRALLEWPWLGAIAALDAEASRDRMGPGADARAWLCLRPYVPEVVEVTVADPADTHPYWLVATRHPQRLARVVRAQLPRADAAEDTVA